MCYELLGVLGEILSYSLDVILAWHLVLAKDTVRSQVP